MAAAQRFTACLGCVALLACGPRDAPKPSFLLITLDTTRADRIGAYGAESAHTPAIDQLAREGVVFEMALAPTPLTLPSHASILTGVYPVTHGVRNNGLFVLPPEATLVSEVLRESGWSTGAFVAAYVLAARFGLDQGFQVYRGVPSQNMRGRHFERPANQVVDDALEWLHSLGPGEPFFAWVHLYDPHHPYRPPEPWDERLENPYDGEIAFSDAQIRRLLAGLDADGRTGNLLTVVTADHGEGLGDHREPTHGTFVYQTTQRVPLVLSGEPVRAWWGQRIRGAVSIVDLAPTLLAFAGIPAERMPEVRAPVLLPRPETPGERAVYLENFYPYYAHRWRGIRGLVWGDHKFVEGNPPEIYALDRDPNELRDLGATHAELGQKLQQKLTELVAAQPETPANGSRPPDADDAAMLEALGYASGSRGDDDPLDPGLPYTHERLGDLDLLRQAGHHVRRARKLEADTSGSRVEREARRRDELTAAREILLRVHAANPEDPTAELRLAKVELSLGNPARAIPALERVVRDEEHVLAHRYNLALAYAGAGRFADARRSMRELLAREPLYLKAYLWLGTHAADRGEYGRASWWISEALRVSGADDPRRPEMSQLLAQVESEMRERAQLRRAPEPL
jgi:arylsulfatase A-like enzyme